MARSESRTKTSIWSDEHFCGLTARAQRLYWMIYSQPTISLCGVVALTLRRWAASACDETPDTVKAALEELETFGYVIVDYDTEEVFVRTFARHDGVWRSPKTFPAAWDQLANISSKALRSAAEAGLAALGPDPRRTDADSPSDSPPIGYPQGISETQDRVSAGLEACGKQPQDRPRTRARAVSVPSHRPPSPSPSPSSAATAAAVAYGDVDEDRVLRTADDDDGAAVELVRRITALCARSSKHPRETAKEAAEIVAWALQSVDVRIIDEAIGWFRSKGIEKPQYPRAVASVIRNKAEDHGIRMSPFLAPVTPMPSLPKEATR